MENSMKNLPIISIVIVILLGGILLVLKNQKPATSAPDTTSGAAYFSTTTVPEQVGTNFGQGTTTAQVFRDFTHETSVIPDSQNPGNYFLGQTLTADKGGNIPAYVIGYDDKEKFFTVTLLTEPLKDARTQAEAYLKDFLRISESDMCKLKYSVGTPISVNEKYAGYDLRFSFCPGSVSL